MHPEDQKRVVWSVSLIALLLGLTPGMAKADQHIVCPAIESSQVSVGSPAGWTGLYRATATLPLQGAEAIFVYGSLREPWGETHPETVRKKDGAVIARFRLPSEPAPVTPDKWMICYYGNGIYQAMKLPNATKECAMTYRRVQDPTEPRRKLISVLSDITCK